MTRQNKRINPQRRIGNDGFQRTRHVFVRHEHAEVLKAQRLRALDSHGHQGSGGFEPNAHEYNLPIGVFLGKLQRIKRGVHDAYRTPLCLLFQ